MERRVVVIRLEPASEHLVLSMLYRLGAKSIFGLWVMKRVLTQGLQRMTQVGLSVDVKSVRKGECYSCRECSG